MQPRNYCVTSLPARKRVVLRSPVRSNFMFPTAPKPSWRWANLYSVGTWNGFSWNTSGSGSSKQRSEAVFFHEKWRQVSRRGELRSCLCPGFRIPLVATVPRRESGIFATAVESSRLPSFLRAQPVSGAYPSIDGHVHTHLWIPEEAG